MIIESALKLKLCCEKFDPFHCLKKCDDCGTVKCLLWSEPVKSKTIFKIKYFFHTDVKENGDLHKFYQKLKREGKAEILFARYATDLQDEVSPNYVAVYVVKEDMKKVQRLLKNFKQKFKF